MPMTSTTSSQPEQYKGVPLASPDTSGVDVVVGGFAQEKLLVTLTSSLPVRLARIKAIRCLTYLLVDVGLARIKT